LGIDCKVGLLERPERLILLLVGLLTAPLRIAGYGLLELILLALALLTYVTTFQRLVHVLGRASAQAVAAAPAAAASAPPPAETPGPSAATAPPPAETPGPHAEAAANPQSEVEPITEIVPETAADDDDTYKASGPQP
jgi:hypothetical protein